jgi:hypothetical protein
VVARSTWHVAQPEEGVHSAAVTSLADWLPVFQICAIIKQAHPEFKVYIVYVQRVKDWHGLSDMQTRAASWIAAVARCTLHCNLEAAKQAGTCAMKPTM